MFDTIREMDATQGGKGVYRICVCVGGQLSHTGEGDLLFSTGLGGSAIL